MSKHHTIGGKGKRARDMPDSTMRFKHTCPACGLRQYRQTYQIGKCSRCGYNPKDHREQVVKDE